MKDASLASMAYAAIPPWKRKKARAEATQTDLRRYVKQFSEAKTDEVKSWFENEVFELVDMRKTKPRNFVTGRWVLTIKRDTDGNFQKCKARWVLRGFQDKQKWDQQTDSPTATRPSFRLACQHAVNQKWSFMHIDLKTAFLQGEDYDSARDVVCQLPPEAGYPPYIGARLRKPAYGMNDAPRKWWNRLDASLRKYKLSPTRADRCCYVMYEEDSSASAGLGNPRASQVSEARQYSGDILEETLDYLLDPVTGSKAKGRKVTGIVLLHVDDLLVFGTEAFRKELGLRVRKEYQIGSQVDNEAMFCGQRLRWQGDVLLIDQDKAVEEIAEIKVEDKTLKDDTVCPPALHTEYRRALGQLNWIQSRTQYHIAYRFSRAASAAASPKISDVKVINKLIRAVRARPVRLQFWPLRGSLRMMGIPDASYKNNEDKSSQRGQCIFLVEGRKEGNTSAK